MTTPRSASRRRNRPTTRPRPRLRLGSHEIIAFIGTCHPDRAKAFYRDTLGLTLVHEDAFAVVFDANGTMLRVTVVTEVPKAGYTVLGWRVPNIVMASRALRRAGVTFERYPGMRQDRFAVWRSPSGARVAWFKDPDGNTLSITQF
jgi:catechol 2,3-dioxygenase-like lactoylglutathione lyase family enzyme